MDNFSTSGPSDPAGIDPQTNQLLGALSAADLERWQPHLDLVELPSGTALRRWDEPQGHVYFPTTASVSVLHLTRGGDSLEVVAVGSEGMVGVPVIMGGGPTPGDATVHIGGHGFRVGSAWVQGEFRTCAAVRRLLLRYAQAMMTHTAQSVICNRFHSIDQRLCRCLLGSLDRASDTHLNLTHESLAFTLGVRREGVTGAALKLQRAGLIHYRRGRMEVLDRVGLEAQSCECYRVVRTEYERLAPPKHPSPPLTQGTPLAALPPRGHPATRRTSWEAVV